MQRYPGTKWNNHLEFKHSNFDDPHKYSIDNIFTVSYGIASQKNLFFYRKMREILERLLESGFLNDLCISEELDSISIHHKQKELMVLGWSHLHPGFYIWLVAVVICFIVFVGEVFVFHIKAKLIEQLLQTVIDKTNIQM
jgi:hypothetical protein